MFTIESELKVRRLLWWRKMTQPQTDEQKKHGYDPGVAVRTVLLGRLCFERRNTQPSERVALLLTDVVDLCVAVPTQYRPAPAPSEVDEWLQWLASIPKQLVRDALPTTEASCDPKKGGGTELCSICGKMFKGTHGLNIHRRMIHHEGPSEGT